MSTSDADIFNSPSSDLMGSLRQTTADVCLHEGPATGWAAVFPGPLVAVWISVGFGSPATSVLLQCYLTPHESFLLSSWAFCQAKAKLSCAPSSWLLNYFYGRENFACQITRMLLLLIFLLLLSAKVAQQQ